MKCMMSSDGTNIVRVSDEEASKLYHNENFKYIAKSVWKEKVRDVEEKEVTPTNKKSNKMSKAQKRNLRKAKKRNSN
jgi:ribonucleotide reductase alpha subunit